MAAPTLAKHSVFNFEFEMKFLLFRIDALLSRIGRTLASSASKRTHWPSQRMKSPQLLRGSDPLLQHSPQSVAVSVSATRKASVSVPFIRNPLLTRTVVPLPLAWVISIKNLNIVNICVYGIVVSEPDLGLLRRLRTSVGSRTVNSSDILAGRGRRPAG
jgi:hypothetical protein